MSKYAKLQWLSESGRGAYIMEKLCTNFNMKQIQSFLHTKNAVPKTSTASAKHRD